MRVLVYGKGSFFSHNKNLVESIFDIAGIIDKKDNNVDKKLIKKKGIYDAILIMIERTDALFEVIDLLKQMNVATQSIILGIGVFGRYKNCVCKFLSDDYGVRLIADDDIIVYNYEDFDDCIKKIIIPLLEIKGELAVNELCEIYREIYELYWSGIKSPLSYNLECELYYRFHAYGSFGFGIIAVCNLRAIYHFKNPYILDLGCADGFYYKYFYSKVKNIEYIGCDIDAYNIEKANNSIKESTARFVVTDFYTSMPKPDERGYFTNVFWNESIQMFETFMQREILMEIKQRIGDKGILSGTAYLKDEKKTEWVHCINAADNVKQIKRLLEEFFENVYVYNDLGMNRMAVFIASDSKLFF